MAPCCSNIVTPLMIKKGEMKIGDKIVFDEEKAVPKTEEQVVAAEEKAPVYASEPAQKKSVNVPLTYKEMTPYMELTKVTDIDDSPMLAVPPSPLSTDQFTEAISVSDVQAFTGFLRTQIGRYMKIEQLIGSNTIEERFGFLVGIGSNFIILQDIVAGNIMLIDLFTIKLTYIYYSEPVLPKGTI